MAEEKNTFDFVPYDSFKEVFLSSPLGYVVTLTMGIIIAVGVGGGLHGLGQGLSNLFQDDLLYQQHVIGIAIPDIYIERDGVKYFSQVDGKNIEDYVK
ncbi:MAG: hypothetical protein QT08_C0017G0028 [archaeon GW2011_AR17]|nr:MAG: hypothetical protein QT08_C0017G0028 [archaeon GW2011_AR17]MBS3154380.1 hypothetical protein [Candidatus Woesearchaeota archaeon]HIH15409.1 hypothetical protein [Nanoarchaeota archaeon]HIH58923.1 hypothetical protein [Nanoarchaeota archaeon]HII13971.1 hypothetical protein [Nanoarchaeota archaeon]